MARNKMEKEFSEKLNGREITPTAASWDRLDAMLSAVEAQAEKPKRNNGGIYLMIAAALVVLMGIGLVMNQKATSAGNPNVENGVAAAPEKALEASGSVKEQLPENAPEVQLAETSGKVTSGVKISRKKIRVEENQTSEPIENPSAQPETQEQLLAADESQDLLDRIHQRIDSREKPAISVNAKNLLQQVDTPQENPTQGNSLFREINRRYQTVKVAVANRNLEENH